MNLKKSLAAIFASGALGVAGLAHATIAFQFNPTGAGTGAGLINGAFTFDEAPGNALGQNGVNSTTPGAPLAPGTTINDLYQANLGTILGATNNTLFTNGGGGDFFTVVAGFSETVTSASTGGGSSTNTFNINNGGFFKICSQSAAGNDLSGTGFSCSGNGILSGTITSGNANLTGFPNTLQNLDNFGSNDYPGVTTVTSTGGATINLTVTFADPNYFPDLLAGSMVTTSFTNSSLITPFNEANPSAAFSSNGTADGDVPHNIGTVNGITGPNFQFQADANSAFDRMAVPEPATLSLIGLALIGLAGVSRRRKA